LLLAKNNRNVYGVKLHNINKVKYNSYVRRRLNYLKENNKTRLSLQSGAFAHSSKTWALSSHSNLEILISNKCLKYLYCLYIEYLMMLWLTMFVLPRIFVLDAVESFLDVITDFRVSTTVPLIVSLTFCCSIKYPVCVWNAP
jgi:hypothetical protein